PGKAVEFAVKMKRMPQESIMKERLKKSEISFEHIKKISEILSQFYNNAQRGPDIDSYGSLKNIKSATDENFEQTKDYVGKIFEKGKYDYIISASERFYKQKKEVFEQRIKSGKIVEYHGDLHSGNIFVDGNDVCIFDCIEFNKSFRRGDIAGDIGFLSMDLEFLGKCHLSKYLIQKYVDNTNDYDIYMVLDFYKCYRAYVRAKVTAFMLKDCSDPKEREKLEKQAKNYFELAYSYARIFDNQKPSIIISCGITATGKSRWLKTIADVLNAGVLRTDKVRKEIMNIDDSEERSKSFFEKHYTEEKRQKVYNEIFRRVKKVLKAGGKIAIDASFIKKENRDYVKKLAKEYGAEFIIIETHASEDVIKSRLEQRRHREDNISDADFENAYKYQLNNFQKPSSEEGVLIRLDTEKDDFSNLKKMRGELEKIFDLDLVSESYEC
ncbi:MAG: AAA family ATPase, partial [Nanobdellota archaeon]